MSAVHVHSAVRRETQRLEAVLESAQHYLPPADVCLIRSAIWDLNECASKIRQRLNLQAGQETELVEAAG